MEQIKPFYLDLTHREIEDIQQKTGEILASGNLILGQYTKQFEQEFASYIGSKYAVSLNSCTSALQILFMVKGAKGKKVAVQTNTNFATVAAILHAGGIPVFMDMDPDYFSPSLEILRDTYTRHPDLAGVAWVHIGGVIHPDFTDVIDYCNSNGLFMVEDCAHAHGSQLRGVKAGNFASGAFSFFPTKVMTTMEGGMITTESEEEAMLARSLRNQGKRGGDFGGMHTDLGSSWRINEVSAYMGLVQLKKLDEMVAHRESAVREISSALNNHGIEYCSTAHMDVSSQYKFIIKFDDSNTLDDLKSKFLADGIILGGGVYEAPCHLHPVFKDVEAEPSLLKNSEKYCPRHICPPITSGTSDADVKRIVSAIKKYLL